MLVVESSGDAERVLAADRDQAVDFGGREVGDDPLAAAVVLERVRSRRPEDRAAARQDAPHLGHAERDEVPLQRPLPAVAVPDELVPAVFDAAPHDRPDYRVEPWAVTASGQHADAHDLSLEADAALKR